MTSPMTASQAQRIENIFALCGTACGLALIVGTSLLIMKRENHGERPLVWQWCVFFHAYSLGFFPWIILGQLFIHYGIPGTDIGGFVPTYCAAGTGRDGVPCSSESFKDWAMEVMSANSSSHLYAIKRYWIALFIFGGIYVIYVLFTPAMVRSQLKWDAEQAEKRAAKKAMKSESERLGSTSDPSGASSAVVEAENEEV